MTSEPEPRISPLWMLLPAVLFVGNFIGALFSNTSNSQNGVYDAGEIIATMAVDAVLIGYVVFAVWASRRPIAPTLALRRTPLRPAVKLAAGR